MKRSLKKRKTKTPLQGAKEECWDLCRKITKHLYGNICYSCGATGLEGSNWQTGHFIPKSICSTELAYDLKNLRPQCSACNIWKSGNWVAFEEHLIRDHGIEYIQELKVRNERTKGMKYDILWFNKRNEELKQILESL